MSQDGSLHDLLHYDKQYSVLICRECQYAIQKSAIDSHLLRHKIYRAERRRILDKVAQLDVFDPENVQTPPINSPPVDGLPLLAGLRCAFPGCGLLCVSTKRMRRHWNEAHPQQGGGDPGQRLAVDVQLQTFFRGTKLKYFVVNSSFEFAAPQPQNDSTATLPETPEGPRIPIVANELPPISSSLTVDLNVLKYFQHFATSASLTLPSIGPTASHHWQTVAIDLALDNTNLMTGMLAISAAHAFCLASDEEAKQLHETAFHHFEQQFSSSYFNNTDNNTSSDLVPTISRQVHSIITMIQWSTLSRPNGLIRSGFSVQSFIKTLQGCLNTPTRPVQEQLLCSAPTLDRSTVTGNDRQSASMARLHGLPFRMTNVFGRPVHPLNVVTLMAAVDILLDCFSKSYAATNPHMIWLAAVYWLERLSDHLLGLLARKVAPALVVFAHAVPLFKHVEQSSWFLDGVAERLLQCVMDQLPKDDAKITELVQGILDEGMGIAREIEPDENYSMVPFLC